MLATSKLIFANEIKQFKNIIPSIVINRHGHLLRGKRPGEAKSLKQRLAEENIEDPEINKLINIGFPALKVSRSKELEKRLNHIKNQRKNINLEKQARSNTLKINLQEVKNENQRTARPFQLKTIAEHYGIYKDLFGLAYFIPRIALDIKYKTLDGIHTVYNGNLITPSEAEKEPEVSFNSKENLLQKAENYDCNLWTIIMTTPDGHLNDSTKEYIHWFKANIPGESLTKGETIVSYLQPFPLKGIGYQRYIFILYKQEKKLNFDPYKCDELKNLEKRTFSTLEFYKKHQNDLTPAGLSFFQSIWDSNLTNFFHNVLEMKEPIFEYDFPEPYIAKEKWFPHKEPFNLYLDKHMDPKKVHQRYLEKKLSNTHPFNGPKPPLQFPNAHPIRDVPSWLKTEIKKDRLKIGRINDI